MSINEREKAIDILKSYNGKNPFLLRLKRDIFINGKNNVLNDFLYEYILNNYNFDPIPIGKTVTISDWYGDKLKEEYSIEFIPTKLKILAYFGHTKTTYHCLVKYRQNMNPFELFVPKKAVWNNFLIMDYHNYNIDFDRYDRLSTSKDINRKLFPHQKEGVKFLLSRKKCILADDMGTGKSTTLTVAAIEGNFDSILIICPASLKTNWKKELLWYVNEREISIIESFKDKNKQELEKFLGYAEGKSNMTTEELRREAEEKGKWKENKFVIINFDILDEFYEIPKTRSKENINKAFENSQLLQYIANKKSLIIIDEAHRLSNNTSIRYKIINDLIKRGNPDSLYLSTGTPITNNPQNLYCLLKLLQDQITDDWDFYMKRYCDSMKIPAKGEKAKWTERFLKSVKKNSWYDLTKDEAARLKEYIKYNAKHVTINNGASNLEELKNKISHIYLRRTKDDLNKSLPNKTIHEIFYDFTQKQKEEYNKLWDEYETAQLEADPNKEINKDLLEGAIYRRYCSNQMVPNTIKLADKFISNNEKVVIFCCYDDEFYTLKDYYGDKCVVYNGKITQKEKDISVKRFLEDDNVKIFLGNIQSAGVGITLTSASKMIFNNISFVPSDNQQSIDRIYRIGQTKDVDIYFQFFKDTQYEKMWNTVMRKDFIINQVIKKEGEK